MYSNKNIYTIKTSQSICLNSKRKLKLIQIHVQSVRLLKNEMVPMVKINYIKLCPVAFYEIRENNFFEIVKSSPLHTIFLLFFFENIDQHSSKMLQIIHVMP